MKGDLLMKGSNGLKKLASGLIAVAMLASMAPMASVPALACLTSVASCDCGHSSSQSVSSQPTSSKPVSSQPTSSQPVSSQPTSSQPVSSQPTSSQPKIASSTPVIASSKPTPNVSSKPKVEPMDSKNHGSPSDKDVTPKTGDSTNEAIHAAAIACASLAGIGAVLSSKKAAV